MTKTKILQRALRLFIVIIIVATIAVLGVLRYTDIQRRLKDGSSLMENPPDDHFVIGDEFTLPMPRLTLPISNLITKQWMMDLRNYLSKIPSNSLISVTSGNSKYENVLLNWLISATVNTDPPLSHILILSLDKPLHQTLVEHGFDSVYVDFKDLLASDILERLQQRKHTVYFVLMILRQTVMRLMNHWGYDAANYDTDAIILKNPEQLYYGDFMNSDLIGSRGTFPGSVRKVLGLTLCAGTFMSKSTLETGIATNN